MAISGISLTDRTKTKNGNEYNATKVGKLTGTAVGTGAAVYTGYAVHNGKKLLTEDAGNLIKEITNFMVASLPEEITSGIKGGFDKFVEEIPKNLRKYINIGSPIIAGVALLSAIGVGAVVDAMINKVKAFKADKANPILRTEQAEAIK